MPKDRSTGIALVGAGGISAAHLDAYRAHGLNVVSICSRDLKRARARRDAFFPAAEATDDFDACSRDSRVAVLDIATHPDVRVDLMRRAFAAGKHVLSQKPFVEDLATGEALVEEAERRGVKLAVNQNGRWAPHLSYLREAVAAGLVGEVIGAHVAIRWNHGWIAGTAVRGGGGPRAVGFRHSLVRFLRERPRRARRFRCAPPSPAPPRRPCVRPCWPRRW